MKRSIFHIYNKVKVTLLQTDIAWAQPDENIRAAQQQLASHYGSDLYVLPEMWSTGFATEPEGIACDEASDPALLWMQQEAGERGCAISGSLAIRCADGSYRNRHYFVDGRAGTMSHYDKHHLFTYGHEDRYYTAGQRPVIVRYEGFRLLLLTCYDLRFPVWSRYTQEREYDAIVIVANWPENRQAAWQVLTRARAVENQCYLIGVNRVGNDHYSRYKGCSCVIDCYGATLAQCRPYEVQALTVNLDLQEMQRRRGKFRVLDDSDNFALNL